jgi:FKBP-type peptidyl-prolyl cis-trans isomerase SlyD
MLKIAKNCLVTLKVEVRAEDGTVLDESSELSYVHGYDDQVFDKLQSLLETKGSGYKFDVTLPPAEAFGEYNKDLVVVEPLSSLPEDATVGMELESEGEQLIWVVESIDGENATLNANHEFAGIPLKVSGEILAIEQLTEDDANAILKMNELH